MSLKTAIEFAIGEDIKGNIYGNGVITTVSGKQYFLKSGASSRTYQCEANGLQELAKANAIRIAHVISVDEHYILTEYIQQGYPSPDFHRILGRQFAQMHRYQGSSYGFYEDNFIGANPQLNLPDKTEYMDWVAFYFNKRILYQYRLTEGNGYASPTLRSGILKLEYLVETILKGSTEPPTLLHGDLWSGNYLCDPDGNPVLIDPAVYYGHREADLAMTKVFGGFSPDFYKAYMEEFPLQEGWEYRENLYKLYHILNHLNLFGRSYLSEAEYLFRSYIA
jgi:fructosamine-3-kinase